MNRIRVAVNGYGVIGKRVADAVRLHVEKTDSVPFVQGNLSLLK